MNDQLSTQMAEATAGEATESRIFVTNDVVGTPLSAGPEFVQTEAEIGEEPK